MAPYVFKILRRLTGPAGAPSLQAGQLFVNEVENGGVLYTGFGDDGTGNATSQVPVGGSGAFADLKSAQTIAGTKTFSASPQIPSPGASDNSQSAAPTSWVQALLNSITGLYAPKANPTFTGTVTVPTAAFGDSSQAAANTSFVQTAIAYFAQNFQFKPEAKAATAAPLPSYTYANGVITAAANGALAIDNVTSFVAGTDLVLVRSETGGNAPYNGLYTVTNAGGSSAPFVLTRHASMSTASEFTGAFVVVSNAGAPNVNANSMWLCNPGTTVTVGSTPIPFSQVNGATDLIPGAGINISGNTIAVPGWNSVSAGSLLKLTAGGLTAAVPGTDYVAPGSTFDSGTA